MDVRKRVDLRIDANVSKLLEEEAERRHCSLNWLIADICREHVDAQMEARAFARVSKQQLAGYEQRHEASEAARVRRRYGGVAAAISESIKDQLGGK